MAAMRTALVGLVSTCLVAALLAAGCGTPGPRPLSPRTAYALPESDPASRGTVQGPRILTEAEQVVVRMGRDHEGRVVVLQVLSPALSPEQQEEVRRAFAQGAWKRQGPVAVEAESWIETIVRNQP
jgi:hypothetical protein